VKHYRKRLEQTTDENQRKQIQKLLLEEEKKQWEAGDFDSDTEKQAC
jgi:hypothetical protein